MSTSSLRACRTLLAQDPIANVLPLGDLYMPLLRVSDVYSVAKGKRVVGVCTVYRAFSPPSVVVGTSTHEVKRALLKKALATILSEFISLCRSNDINLFRECATIVHSHMEQQMIAAPPKQIEHGAIKVERVDENELEVLDKFYVEHRAEAWVPIQFEAGPYYCIKQDGKIVSAAGVHAVTPKIASLGNILTDKAYRNRGFATACTSVLAGDLASKGRIISLFVRTDNMFAIRLYEKLGFRKTGDFAFLIMRKKACAAIAGR